MIAKSSTGSSFGGLSNYIEGKGEEKAEWKDVQNLADDDQKHYLEMMRDNAERSRAEKPVYHLSISYEEGQNPSPEQMLSDGKQTLEELGLGDHQAVFVGHGDKDYEHFHIMANRVGPDGKAWNSWQDKARCKDIMRELEAEHGYEKVSEKKWGKGQNLSRGEYKQLEAQGREMPMKAKAEFYEVDDLLDKADSWEQAQTELSEIGWQVEIKGNGGVIRDTASKKSLKLSRLGGARNHSFGNLEDRFGKLRKYNKAKEASKQLGKQIPDKGVRKAFGKVARQASGKAGKDAITKGAEKAFKSSMKNAMSTASKGKAIISGLSSIASGSNPVTGVAKMGLKIGKKVFKGIQKTNQLSR